MSAKGKSLLKILLKVLYTVLPKKAINALGKSIVLKEVRNKLLRPGNKEIIISEIVKWGNGKFVFFAPLKIAIKAKNNGIENKLLRNALKLLNDRRIKNPVILDIGANFGFVSLALQANLDSNTKIYSFEPHPEICSVFEKSIFFLNFSRGSFITRRPSFHCQFRNSTKFFQNR